MTYDDIRQLLDQDVIVEKMMKPVGHYPGYRLNSRQAKVLFFFLKGFSQSGVAKRLEMPFWQVSHTLSELMKVFDVDSYDELISKCYQKGFYNLIPLNALIQ